MNRGTANSQSVGNKNWPQKHYRAACNCTWGSELLYSTTIVPFCWCDEKLQASYLLLGNCMTYNSSSSDEQEYDAVSFGGCSYIYNSNLVNHRYIALPHNISDLNGIFCAPINRHRLLCCECIDGFGPSVATTDFACANCTGNNYGWMLYILLEFIPATVFYFVVLTLPIRITSA